MSTNYLIDNNVLMPTATPGGASIADPVYESHGVFSINAANQLKGTLWMTKNGQVMTDELGVASYQVYDATGAAVSGLSESGLTPDVNGIYDTALVSAASLQDLTHYVVKINIGADDDERISYRGITLGE
jgi:hypothetical protein